MIGSLCVRDVSRRTKVCAISRSAACRATSISLIVCFGLMAPLRESWDL
jgi:hypothetical protein